MNVSSSISEFPIASHLEKICQSVKTSPCHALVLTAETGAGKSTVFPLALLQDFGGKIIMTEPRRLATVGVANRISELLGENCGNTVGYRIHLESKISERTRFEVMTEGILIRMLQDDPTIENVNLVILDEFHERSINTDLALSFLREAMELRDDLFVIVMSATIDSRKIAAFLGSENEPAPVMEISGRTFPVNIEYKPSTSIEDEILFQIKNAFSFSKTSTHSSQTILVFLPGLSEIRKTKNTLLEKIGDKSDIELCILHSSISFQEQKHILSRPNPGTIRVVLSSAIAETSLTIPCVTCVIDSGLSRINRLNVSTGMETLVTERVSQFSATQRAGRAGREQEGTCIRLWNKFDVLQEEVQPEILRCDITQVVLECLDRGVSELSKIKWLDSPQKNAWKTAEQLLQNLSCIDKKSHILQRGKECLQLGVSVRLACIGLDGMNDKGKLTQKAREVLIKYSQYSQTSTSIQNQFLTNFEQKFSKLCPNLSSFNKVQSNFRDFSSSDYQSSSLLLLSGFPDRIAIRLSENEFQFPSGRKAILHNSKHTNSKWIIAPGVSAGQTQGIIFDFEELQEKKAEEWLYLHSEEKTISTFTNGKIIKTQNTTYGEIVLSSKKLPASLKDYADAWMNEVHSKGIQSLPHTSKTDQLLERISFFAQQNPDQEEKLDTFFHSPETWLKAFITENTLSADTVYQAISWHFSDWSLDKNAPEEITLSNGIHSKIRYEKLASPDDRATLVIRPVIEIIIQRAFGCIVTPKISGMKVLFRLLSPSRRPLQITDDLENFWLTTWPEICKEMKGRYPKHNWNVVQKD